MSSNQPHVLTASEENTYVDSRLGNDERALRKSVRKITELLQSGTASTSPNPARVWEAFTQELNTVKLLVRKANIVTKMEESSRAEYRRQGNELGAFSCVSRHRRPRPLVARSLLLTNHPFAP